MIEPILMIILTIILGVSVGFLALIFLMIRAFLHDLYSFMTPGAENEHAPVDNFIKHLSDSVGESIIFHGKQATLGKISGEARLGKAIEGDITQDLLSAKNPLLGMALENMPSLKKRALKNPAVIQWILENLGSSKVFNRPPASGNGPSDFAQRLAKYQ